MINRIEVSWPNSPNIKGTNGVLYREGAQSWILEPYQDGFFTGDMLRRSNVVLTPKGHSPETAKAILDATKEGYIFSR